MGSLDKFAKNYDKIFSEYKEDISFYKNICLKEKGEILEIGCGTGRIYLEILPYKSITGIDISGEMLKILDYKAKERGLKPIVYKKDMKNFNFRKKFSLIIIPFRTFLHNLTIEDQIATLKNLKKHLKPKGRVILNFYYPDPKILNMTDYKKTKEGTYFIDKPNQITELKTNYGSFQTAYIFKREFELLLRLSGFKKYKVFGDFDLNPLKEFNQEMVWFIYNN